MTKSLWSGDERYLAEYWSRFGDLWDHGDWAQKDEDGFWFLHGRSDEGLNVAGGRSARPRSKRTHRYRAVNAAPRCRDETKGTALVTRILNDGVEESADLARRCARSRESAWKPFRPREVRFVGTTKAVGKAMRENDFWFYEGADQGTSQVSRTPTRSTKSTTRGEILPCLFVTVCGHRQYKHTISRTTTLLESRPRTEPLPEST